MFNSLARLFSLLMRTSPHSPSMPGTKQPHTLLFNFLPNNVHVAVSDTLSGRLHFKLNAGAVGMKGTAKCSPKACLALIDAVHSRLQENGIAQVRVNFRGLNSARPLIVHQLKKCGIDVDEVIDTTRVPFNGCRPRKSRRL